MGCSGSKKESPLDPSDVQLSGGDPLSQLSGGDPLSGDWSRSEQRRSSAADLDPSDAFRALDVSRGEASTEGEAAAAAAAPETMQWESQLSQDDA